MPTPAELEHWFSGQRTPKGDADPVLAAAGYTMFDPSLVMTMPLAAGRGDSRVRIEHAPSAEWLQAFADANGVPGAMQAVHDAIVRAIALPAAAIMLGAWAAPGLVASFRKSALTEFHRQVGVQALTAVNNMLFKMLATPDR